MEGLSPAAAGERAMRESLMTTLPTDRIERMREAYFTMGWTASLDRARIETRVLKETEGQPTITRRAKIFAAVMREIPIDIYPDELLVGCSSVGQRGGNVSPNTYAQSMKSTWDISHGDREPSTSVGLSDEEMKELEEELVPYWQTQGIMGRYWNYGHNIHGMEKVLKEGFLGIKKEAEDRLARIDSEDPADLAKVPFLEGVVLAMEAAAGFGGRFAARARELAQAEPDEKRKAELLKIADICDQVPAKPARTFHEALQSYHLAWLMLLWELSRGSAFSQGRMDQYLYPYYEADIREGRITREEAQELLDAYIIKLNLVGDSGSIGVGGLKADGNDATNELSHMFIESIMHTRLTNPYFAVHVHSKTPDDLLIRACELCSLGIGHPQFLNSDVGVAQAMARGSEGGEPITLTDARTAANVGCLELVIPGKDAGYLYSAPHNLALAVELVLTNGIRRSDGAKIGVETGDPRQFTCFGEIQEAFCRQLELMRRNSQVAISASERGLIEVAPTVYESALIEDCIDKGISKEEGGARYDFNIAAVELGSSDAGDSLAAIKRLVFDEKTVAMDQLCDALADNFDGCEDIRRMCLGVPKFGNDEDYVDEQVAWVLHQWATEFRKLRNLRGRNGSAGGSTMSDYIPHGRMVGALPSGRLAGEPLAPAGSPSIGMDRKGATSVFKSMGKVDGVEIPAGLSLTTRIDPAVFENKDGIRRMADLIRTFVDQNVFHVQFNVVSTDTLIAAQEKPKEYRDLMVKVAGYSAFFTRLSKSLQDTIINRTEHGL